jgi:urease subunit beta
VELVSFGGNKKLVGFNNLANGETTSASAKEHAMNLVQSLHFKNNKG